MFSGASRYFQWLLGKIKYYSNFFFSRRILIFTKPKSTLRKTISFTDRPNCKLLKNPKILAPQKRKRRRNKKKEKEKLSNQLLHPPTKFIDRKGSGGKNLEKIYFFPSSSSHMPEQRLQRVEARQSGRTRKHSGRETSLNKSA